MDHTLNDRLLSKKSVIAKVGLSGSTIHRKIAKGEFPRPIYATSRSVRWLESEIEHWIADLAENGKRA